MAGLASSLLALRKDPRLLHLPPFLSSALIIIGCIWLLLLPLDNYSRRTYISENALLPGQVHTYFGGSEQNIFNAYRHEVVALADKSQHEISTKLRGIFRSSGLKVASQKYEYSAAGVSYAGENVYAILHAPRGDATEAVVLVAAWRNMQDQLNQSGVALALTLARYFKRWSLWSKDIVFLITPESRAGPQAWVEAYHDSHSPPAVASLPLKSGALEGAIVVDNPLDHPFENTHIIYDGVNGQLPNLDLFNTAVSISSGQHGIGALLQRMWKHDDGYRARLQTIWRGMVRQGLGQATGPHSCFLPFHVDAITIQTEGNGWQDDMALGRVVESLFRSLNNLMEHFHQSFFLYLLMQTNRFVSIGTYLPSAMLVAANFTIMALSLWIASGRPIKSSNPDSQPTLNAPRAGEKYEVVEHKGMTAVIPQQEFTITERHLLVPAGTTLLLHFVGLLPLFLFNNTAKDNLQSSLLVFTLANAALPFILPNLIQTVVQASPQHILLLKSFSLLLLGIFLATLATVNFSLSFFIGLLCAPLSLLGPLPTSFIDNRIVRPSVPWRLLHHLMLQLISPPLVFAAVCWTVGADITEVMAEATFGWRVWGVWTQVIVWCVWWPAWLAAAGALARGLELPTPAQARHPAKQNKSLKT